MRVHVDNPEHLDDLAGFLRERGCIALRFDDRSLEALVPDTATPLTERLEVELFVRCWQALREDQQDHRSGRSRLLAA
jgi:hypothetical protein